MSNHRHLISVKRDIINISQARHKESIMYRALIYTADLGEEVILYRTEWLVTLEDCFRAAPFNTRDSSRYYRKIESKIGTIEYYFQLFDQDGSVVKRSENYFNAERCLSSAELESQQSGCHYSIERIITPNTHILYAETMLGR